jgi:hypothetical protein
VLEGAAPAVISLNQPEKVRFYLAFMVIFGENEYADAVKPGQSLRPVPPASPIGEAKIFAARIPNRIRRKFFSLEGL